MIGFESFGIFLASHSTDAGFVGGVLRKKSMGSTLAGSLHDTAELLVEILGPESPLLKMIDWRSWISSRLRAL